MRPVFLASVQPPPQVRLWSLQQLLLVPDECALVANCPIIGGFWLAHKSVDANLVKMSGIACLGVDQTQVSKRRGSTRPNFSESGAISVLGLRLV